MNYLVSAGSARISPAVAVQGVLLQPISLLFGKDLSKWERKEILQGLVRGFQLKGIHVGLPYRRARVRWGILTV